MERYFEKDVIHDLPESKEEKQKLQIAYWTKYLSDCWHMYNQMAKRSKNQVG